MEDGCKKADHPPNDLSHSFCLDNIMELHPSSMEVGPEKVRDPKIMEERSRVAWPQLGPWQVMTRIRLSKFASASSKGRKATRV